MLHALATNWWLMLLRGLAAICFGVLAFAWPSKTLLVLLIFFAAYMLVDGVLALAAAVAGRGTTMMQTWWLVMTGLLGIGAGVLTYFWPGVTALILIMFIGAWALVQGLFQIIGAIQLRKEIDDEWLLVASGAISMLFGIAVLVSPGAGALALVWVVAVYAVLFGGLMVAFSLRLRKYRS
jgi:uncharacterized membrane protein HdeD (DUF308 family)